MELTRLTLPIVDLSVDLHDDESSGLDGQVGEYPPSSAHSFLSTSSSFGPYTPTSGRSTPRMGSEAMDFASSFASSASSDFGPCTPTSERPTPHESDLVGLASFASAIDPFSFNLTPPSSALSAYFQVGLKTDGSYDMFQSHFPTTPSRNQELSGLSSCSYGSQLTPSQPMNFYPFINELGPSPFPPNPLQSVQPDQNWDRCSVWVQPGSPINFEKRKGSIQLLAEAEDENDVSLSLLTGSAGRRLLFKPAKEETIQLGSHLSMRKRARVAKTVNTAITNDSLQTSKVPMRKFKCSYEGCIKQYERKEHLKRHVESNHLGAKHKCQYCDKTFNRTDNRRYHLQLHAKDRKAGRVEYMAGAEQSLEEEMKRSKRRRSTR